MEFRRDAVAQSILTAQFIDAHIDAVPPAEEFRLASESSAIRLFRDARRFSLLASRPSYSAWRLHTSLGALVQSLKAIDEPTVAERPEAHQAKRAAFALVSLAKTTTAFDAYVRYDKTRTSPVLSPAALDTATVSLENMGPALAWFVSCTVDVLTK